jgi:hypothetical protein
MRWFLRIPCRWPGSGCRQPRKRPNRLRRAAECRSGSAQRQIVRVAVSAAGQGWLCPCCLEITAGEQACTARFLGRSLTCLARAAARSITISGPRWRRVSATISVRSVFTRTLRLPVPLPMSAQQRIPWASTWFSGRTGSGRNRPKAVGCWLMSWRMSSSRTGPFRSSCAWAVLTTALPSERPAPRRSRQGPTSPARLSGPSARSPLPVRTSQGRLQVGQLVFAAVRRRQVQCLVHGGRESARWRRRPVPLAPAWWCRARVAS